MENIRFDDVEKLRSKVSQGFSAWSQPIDVTQDKMNQFADVTGDHQWIHIDIERAKRESPFKTPVAHGFLTLSLIPAFEIPREWNVTSFRNVRQLRREQAALHLARAGRREGACALACGRGRTEAAGHASHDGDPGPGGGTGQAALIYEGIFLYVK